MRQFQRQEDAASILRAKLRREFKQRARQTLAHSEADEIGVTLEHRPPAADRKFERAAEAFKRHPERKSDEGRGACHANQTIAESFTAKRAGNLREQRGDAENLARADQYDQHLIIA